MQNQNSKIKILAIDTSCDETSIAVTEGTMVLSNIIWSQASLHAKFGGIYPSLAKRQHEERIDFLIEKALIKAFPKSPFTSYKLLAANIDAVTVTIGPGLAIALEVGIKKAKELAIKYNKPLITINHVEGHILSCLVKPKTNSSELTITNYRFPVLTFIASGGTTQLILVKEIGRYEIIAQTSDDALGEALDKAARMLGLGYPGGAILEKMARDGNPNSYILPVPMIGQENKLKFSYSGLKTAFYKIVEKEKPLTREKIQNLAASYQNVAFEHVTRIIKFYIQHSIFDTHELWFGGGVSANIALRKRIRKLCNENKILMRFPYSKNLCTDNAAMIGIAAYYKDQRKEYVKDINKVERFPRLKLD